MDLANGLAVAFEQPLGHLPDVPQDVPAIYHLQGVRRADRRSACILRRAVADDDLDARMLLQPRRERRGAAVGQQIDRAPGLKVDEDGAVPSAPSPRPVVDAEHPRSPQHHPSTSQEPR
jgi:hypothetical protein